MNNNIVSFDASVSTNKIKQNIKNASASQNIINVNFQNSNLPSHEKNVVATNNIVENIELKDLPLKEYTLEELLEEGKQTQIEINENRKPKTSSIWNSILNNTPQNNLHSSGILNSFFGNTGTEDNSTMLDSVLGFGGSKPQKELTEEEKLLKQIKKNYRNDISLEDHIKELNQMGYKSQGANDYWETMESSNQFEYKGNKYTFVDGKCKKIEYSTGLVVTITYDSLNEVTPTISYGLKNKSENISIFGEYNIDAEQFGGDQGSLYSDSDEFLEDPNVLKILKKYYPNRTLEDYELFLKKINETGCGYTAMVNTIFKRYEGKEVLFEKTFGFPMYTIKSNGVIDFNYEYLILESFTYILEKNNEYSFDEVINSVKTTSGKDGAISGEETEVNTGTGETEVQLFEYWLRTKGIKSDFVRVDLFESDDPFFKKQGVRHAIKELKTYFSDIKSSEHQLILSASGYDLYTLDGELYYDNGGGHAMYITDITDKGEIVVSSWGNEYIVDLSDASRIGYYFVNYNPKNHGFF